VLYFAGLVGLIRGHFKDCKFA